MEASKRFEGRLSMLPLMHMARTDSMKVISSSDVSGAINESIYRDMLEVPE